MASLGNSPGLLITLSPRRDSTEELGPQATRSLSLRQRNTLAADGRQDKVNKRKSERAQ